MKRALAVGILACAACSGPERVPPLEHDLRRTADQARLAFGSGDLLRAKLLFGRVLELARLVDDPLAAGNAGFNLALVHAEAGDLALAESVLTESEAALRRAGEPLADASLLRAKIAWLRGDAPAAERGIATALADQRTAPNNALARECAVLKGHLACDRKDVLAARESLATARGLAASIDGGAESPGLLHLEGRIEAVEGRPASAAALWDREAAKLRSVRNYRQMAQALARAGEAHAAGGAPAMAGDRVLRAARSRLAAGDFREARVLARRAGELAESSGDTALIQRVAGLAAELQ